MRGLRVKNKATVSLGRTMGVLFPGPLSFKAAATRVHQAKVHAVGFR